MTRWLLLFALAVTLIGCDRLRPGPTPTATAVATVVPAPTGAPSATPLPPTVTLEPTEPPTVVSAVPTGTAAPTGTPIETPTLTRVRPAATRKVTATNTVVAFKYGAPKLIGPNAGDTRLEGKDDLLFKWQPAGDLGPNECYLVTVQVVNLADPLQHYGQDSFLAQETCNTAASAGTSQFTLRKKNPPSYTGLVAVATSIGGPSSEFRVRWWVTVVLSDGTPLSPPSAQSEFTLSSP